MPQLETRLRRLEGQRQAGRRVIAFPEGRSNAGPWRCSDGRVRERAELDALANDDCILLTVVYENVVGLDENLT